jgi:hypothetical protein
MSITPTPGSATAQRSGRWLRTAPTRRPPFERPSIRSRSRPCSPGLHEVVRRRDEVVEDVLLALLGPGQVPGLAVFAAAAEVRHGVDAAHLDPDGRRHGVGGRDRDVEAAVAVEPRRACDPSSFRPLPAVMNIGIRVPSREG